MAYTGIPAFPLTDIVIEHTDKGTYWGLLGGLQAKCDAWIVGVELNLDWQNIGKKFEFAYTDAVGAIGWAGQARLKTTPVMGLTGLMAYEIAPYFIPFMRLGVETSQDKLDATFTAIVPSFPMQITIQNTEWQFRYVAGFGVTIPLFFVKQLLLRLEYDYHSFFNDKGTKASGLITTNFIKPSFIASMHPRTQSGKIALLWNF